GRCEILSFNGPLLIQVRVGLGARHCASSALRLLDFGEPPYGAREVREVLEPEAAVKLRGLPPADGEERDPFHAVVAGDLHDPADHRGAVSVTARLGSRDDVVEVADALVLDQGAERERLRPGLRAWLRPPDGEPAFPVRER